MKSDPVPHYRCPTCKRRMHRALREPLPCRVCGKPVEYNGAGRRPFLHYECRSGWRKLKPE